MNIFKSMATVIRGSGAATGSIKLENAQLEKIADFLGVNTSDIDGLSTVAIKELIVLKKKGVRIVFSILLQAEGCVQVVDDEIIMSLKENISTTPFKGINKLAVDSTESTIFHESCHVDQILRGDLDLNVGEGKVKWKGDVFDVSNKSVSDYFQYPWEIEAYRHQFKKMKEIPSISLVSPKDIMKSTLGQCNLTSIQQKEIMAVYGF